MFYEIGCNNGHIVIKMSCGADINTGMTSPIAEAIRQKFGGVTLTEETAPSIMEELKLLAQKARIPMPNIHVVDALPGFGNLGKINAGAILKNDVVLTKGILELFGCADLKGPLDPRLKAVIAHEFSHCKAGYLQPASRFVPLLLGPVIAVAAYHLYHSAHETDDKAHQHEALNKGESSLLEAIQKENGHAPESWQQRIVKTAKHVAAAALGLGAGILVTRGLMNHYEWQADALSKTLMGSGKPLAEALQMLEDSTRELVQREGLGFELTPWTKFKFALTRILNSHPSTEARVAELMR